MPSALLVEVDDEFDAEGFPEAERAKRRSLQALTEYPCKNRRPAGRA